MNNALVQAEPNPLGPFDALPILPEMIAANVASEPYTGQEISGGLGERTVARIEAARAAMTGADVSEFAASCLARCQAAHHFGAAWWRKIVQARGNSGRDQLYTWTRHWLAAWLEVHKLWADTA